MVRDNALIKPSLRLKSLLEGKPSDVVELPRRIFDTPSDAHEKHKIFEVRLLAHRLADQS